MVGGPCSLVTPSRKSATRKVKSSLLGGSRPPDPPAFLGVLRPPRPPGPGASGANGGGPEMGGRRPSAAAPHVGEPHWRRRRRVRGVWGAGAPQEGQNISPLCAGGTFS